MKAAGFADAVLPPEARVDPQWSWVWRAWTRLSPDRPRYGGAFGPEVPGDIPWSLVRLWAEHHGLTRSEFVFLDHCIQALDAVYRECWMARNQGQGHATQQQSRPEA